MHLANLDIAEALESLGTSATGLSASEAERRHREYGANCILAIDAEPEWRRLLREFTHFFAIILWVAAGLAFFAESREPEAGMWQLGVAILAVIFINGTFSFWQESRAGRAIDALRKLLPQTAKVVRDGQLTTLPVEVLVPGDIILLEAGDNVPADCRLIASTEIRVNTATITGESLPKAKSAESCPEGKTALDTRNLLLAGTSLVSGEGRALVFATGMHTEFGQIAHLTQTAESAPSHLQQEIARLSRLVAVFATGLGLVFFLVGLNLGLPFWANLMFAIGIIVANVPEGLLPTVTLSLAMATQRMARRNALIRHLPAVETLGATTVICSDKTGTLTENRMAARQTYVHGRLHEGPFPLDEAGTERLLRNLSACHSLKQGTRGGQPVLLGDPMELALVEFASQARTFADMTPTGEFPFDSERRRMSVIVAQDGELWLYCKGAPEAVMPLCNEVETANGREPFDPLAHHAHAQVQQRMADAGLRVLAFAWRRLETDIQPREERLVLSGLVGLYDPPGPRYRRPWPAAARRGSRSSWSPATTPTRPWRLPVRSASSGGNTPGLFSVNPCAA